MLLLFLGLGRLNTKKQGTIIIIKEQAKHVHLLVRDLGFDRIVILDRIIPLQIILQQRSCGWIHSLSVIVSIPYQVMLKL